MCGKSVHNFYSLYVIFYGTKKHFTEPTGSFPSSFTGIRFESFDIHACKSSLVFFLPSEVKEKVIW